jgi:hypothetical protein
MSNIHDGRVKFLLNEFILSESLLANSELCSDVSGTLAVESLKFVVFGTKDLFFLTASFIFNLEFFDRNQIFLVHVHHSLKFIALAKDCEF